MHRVVVCVEIEKHSAELINLKKYSEIPKFWTAKEVIMQISESSVDTAEDEPRKGSAQGDHLKDPRALARLSERGSVRRSERQSAWTSAPGSPAVLWLKNP